MNNFVHKVNPIIGDLQEIVQKSWIFTMTDFSYRPLARDKIWRAKTMSGHMRACLMEKFDNQVFTEKGSFYLKVNNYRLYFRKLNNRLCPTKPMTQRAKSIQGYCQLKIDFGEQYTVSDYPVFIGYQLNSTEESISGIYAVKLTDGKPEWIYPISTNLDNVYIEKISSNEERLVKPKRSLLGLKRKVS